MEIFYIKKISNPKVVMDDFGEVCRIERNVVLFDSRNEENYKVTLEGLHALSLLKTGQLVIADLRVDFSHCNGQEFCKYYVLSFYPLEENVIIEKKQDWTTKIV